MRKINWELPVQTEEYFTALNEALSELPYVTYAVGTKTLDGDYVDIDLFLDYDNGPEVNDVANAILQVGTAIGAFTIAYLYAEKAREEAKEEFDKIMDELFSEKEGEEEVTEEEVSKIFEDFKDDIDLEDKVEVYKDSKYYKILKKILKNFKK